MKTPAECNSKASYLPRQSLEKLSNGSDPDRGSYKLTLNSNEDLVGSVVVKTPPTAATATTPTKSSNTYDILAQHNGGGHHHHHHHHNGGGGIDGSQTTAKLPSNLPDVLPLGVKLQSVQMQQQQQQQQQPSSPTGNAGGQGMPHVLAHQQRYSCSSMNSNSSNGSSISCSSSSNSTHSSSLARAHNTNTQTPAGYGIGGGGGYMPPQHQRYSTPAPPTAHSQMLHYSRSQSFDINGGSGGGIGGSTGAGAGGGGGGNLSPVKYMSQSTIDLKRAPNLETTFEELQQQQQQQQHLQQSLSPAQSESCLLSAHQQQQQQQRKNNNNQAKVEQESNLFRAELVNTTLTGGGTNRNSNSNSNPKLHHITRKDSLRENIEKITQLQTQLMSAHLKETKATTTTTNTTTTTTTTATTTASNETQEEAHSDEFASALSDAATPVMPPPTEATAPPPPPTTPAPAPAPPPTATTAECSSDNSISAGGVTSADADESTSIASHGVLATPIAQMDTSTDGLKLMQRSEIVLRVNPSTVEAASQTDELPEGDLDSMAVGGGGGGGSPTTTKTTTKTTTATTGSSTLQPRVPQPIELDCDSLSRELAALLPADDRLLGMLALPPLAKCAADYVSHLYNPNVPVRPCKRDVGTSTLVRMRQPVTALVMGVSLLNGDGDEHHDDDDDVDNGDGDESDDVDCDNKVTTLEYCDANDPTKRKMHELIKHLQRKLKVLSRELCNVAAETTQNDELGNGLLGKLADKVRPLEASKLRTYIDDVGHITSLLLSLSERLARVENGLNTSTPMATDTNTEQHLLEAKRDRLREQLDEAHRLKVDIDRRGATVAGVLERHLTADDLADFDYFINMKAKLIADARDIADKIKCGEEQLGTLTEVLMQSDC